MRQRRGGSDRPVRTTTTAPLRLLPSALPLGWLFGNPVHDEVRPDVGAAICKSDSFTKGAIEVCAVTKDRVFRALVVGPCKSILAHHSPSA